MTVPPTERARVSAGDAGLGYLLTLANGMQKDILLNGSTEVPLRRARKDGTSHTWTAPSAWTLA